MQKKKNSSRKPKRIATIRNIVALDIVFHGPRFILIEFCVSVLGCAALGFWVLSNSNHAIFMLIVGCLLVLLAVDYVPLLLYAISIIRRKSARQEVEREMRHSGFSAQDYTFQIILLLLIPLSLPILALYQELRKRART